MGRAERQSSEPPEVGVGPSLQVRTKAAAGLQSSTADGQSAGLEGASHAGWLGGISARIEGRGEGMRALCRLAPGRGRSNAGGAHRLVGPGIVR